MILLYHILGCFSTEQINTHMKWGFIFRRMAVLRGSYDGESFDVLQENATESDQTITLGGVIIFRAYI